MYDIQTHIAAILLHIEGHPNNHGRLDLRPGLLKTPERVEKAMLEMYSGYLEDPAEILSATFNDSGLDTYSGMVVERDIQFFSMCEHHMLPFFGRAHVAYIPNKKVVGLSKLARLVDAYAKRLQVQERISDQIVQALTDHLQPLGAMVILEAEHHCMCARGIRKHGSKTLTSSLSGEFEKPEVRAELLSLLAL